MVATLTTRQGSGIAIDMLKKLAAYICGLIGFCMQGFAAIIPVYSIFFGGPAWLLWVMLPLGIAGMLPLGAMKMLLEEQASP